MNTKTTLTVAVTLSLLACTSEVMPTEYQAARGFTEAICSRAMECKEMQVVESTRDACVEQLMEGMSPKPSMTAPMQCPKEDLDACTEALRRMPCDDLLAGRTSGKEIDACRTCE
jgi:hypothetical protein